MPSSVMPFASVEEYKPIYNFSKECLRRLLVTANVVPSSPILVTLMMEALNSSETSVLTRATQRNISEDAIFHSYRRENLKSYIFFPKFFHALLNLTRQFKNDYKLIKAVPITGRGDL
jgi:hypothetical protein